MDITLHSPSIFTYYTLFKRNRLEELERRLERNEAARKLKTLQKTEAKGRDNMSDNAMKQKRKQIKVYKSVNQKLRRFLDGSNIPLQFITAIRSVLIYIKLSQPICTIHFRTASVYDFSNLNNSPYVQGSHPPRNVKPSVRSSAAESVLMKVTSCDRMGAGFSDISSNSKL